LPLHVFEPRYRELVREVMGGRKIMAVARLKPGFELDYEGRPPVFDVCGVGLIINHAQRTDGRFDITLRGLSRARIIEELPPERAFRRVRAARILDTPCDQALTRGANDAGAYADRLAAAMVADPEASQELLTEPDPAERFRLLTGRIQELVDALSPHKAENDAKLN